MQRHQQLKAGSMDRSELGLDPTKEVAEVVFNSTEAMLEKVINDKGLNAPRLTPQDISDTIVKQTYVIIDDTTTTVCALTLRNGYIVTGESAAVSKENFDEEIGREVAFNNARDKIWSLEGYLLKQKLYEETS